MNKILISSVAVLMLCAGGGARAEDSGAHTTHNKAMKEAGHRDGEPMENKAPEAQPSAPPTTEEKAAKKHRVHSKAMKEAGAQDGKEMSDFKPARHADPKEQGPKAGDPDTHTTHNKAMKGAGHKDGEPMKN